jgi:hypothetical protein
MIALVSFYYTATLNHNPTSLFHRPYKSWFVLFRKFAFTSQKLDVIIKQVTTQVNCKYITYVATSAVFVATIMSATSPTTIHNFFREVTDLVILVIYSTFPHCVPLLTRELHNVSMRQTVLVVLLCLWLLSDKQYFIWTAGMFMTYLHTNSKMPNSKVSSHHHKTHR